MASHSSVPITNWDLREEAIGGIVGPQVSANVAVGVRATSEDGGRADGIRITYSDGGGSSHVVTTHVAMR